MRMRLTAVLFVFFGEIPAVVVVVTDLAVRNTDAVVTGELTQLTGATRN